MQTESGRSLAARTRYRSSNFSIDAGNRLGHVSHQALFDLGHRRAHIEVAQLRHRESAITARVDVVEGREIHVEIEREAVVGAAIADLETQRGDFGLPAIALDVDARRIAPAVRVDPIRIEQFYHGALDRLDQRSHAEAQSLEVDQKVDDQLSRPVISDLAPSIDLQNRNGIGAQNMLGATGEAERVHRRVLGQPDFVCRVGSARVGESLHRAPGADVVGPPETLARGRVALGWLPARCCRVSDGRRGESFVQGWWPATSTLKDHHDLWMPRKLAVELVELLA